MVIFWIRRSSLWIVYSDVPGARKPGAVAARAAVPSSCRARARERRAAAAGVGGGRRRRRLLRRRRRASAAAAPRVAGRSAHDAVQRTRNAPRSPTPSPAPKRRRAARSSSSWRLPQTATTPSRCCGRRSLALAVPLPLILATQMAGRAHLSASARRLSVSVAIAVPMGAAPLRAGADMRQARPRASEGRRAVPGAEPAHHQGPHRRAHLRLLRRALCRGHRRRRHLPQSLAKDLGGVDRRADRIIAARATGGGLHQGHRDAAGRFSPSISRRAQATRTSCPTT